VTSFVGSLSELPAHSSDFFNEFIRLNTGLRDEKVFPEDALAGALRGFAFPLEPSSILSFTNRKVSEFFNFHLLFALSFKKESLIVKDKDWKL